MALIVQKFGGTSVGTPARIREVAQRVAAAREHGDELVVVVSAMGDTTDDLAGLAAEVTQSDAVARRHPREWDMLLTAGERISIALLAMALREAGHEAISFTGSQAAIITDGTHTAARIDEVRGDRVRAELNQGRIVIVAGFQGVSRDREITTLGRGGSDTTAVALAAALGAERCEVFTDVTGVFTADPRRVSSARVVAEIGYAEMLELASAGAQVMHPRAVEIAARFRLPVRVLFSFDPAPRGADDRPGTLILEHPTRMEDAALTGIASMPGQAKLILHGLPYGLGTLADILVRLAEAEVSVDMITEARETEGRIQLQLTVAEAALSTARPVVAELMRRFPGAHATEQGGLSRIALVGSGMHNRPGVYATVFRTLLAAEAELHAVSTSAVSVTVLVPTEHEQQAVRALHAAFELDRGAAEPPQ